MPRKPTSQSTKLAQAWKPDEPAGHAWTARPWVDPQVRVDEGHLQRKRVPRTDQAAFEARSGRDPIAIMLRQEADRLQQFVPLRDARMAEPSPFASDQNDRDYQAFVEAIRAARVSTTAAITAHKPSR